MDFAPYYRTNVKKSVKEDREQIIAGFQEIVKSGARVGLRLVNYYRGLPLSYPATLVEVTRGVLELDVHRQQAVALENNRHTFVKCDYFDSAILAEVMNVNVRSMTASLRRFSFVQILAENRSSLRLELEPQTDAELRWEGSVHTGKVLDLSLGGFSIRTADHCEIPKGAEATVIVMVPNLLQNTLSKLETKATLVESSREGDWDICRFCIVADLQSEALISRFIFQRQVEIIRELKVNS